MSFLFKKIDIPGGSGANGFVYISVDGVDSAGLAVGNFGDTSGDWHGFTAVPNGPFATYDPPLSSNSTDIVGITNTGEVYGDYTDWTNKQHGFVENNGVTTTIDYPLAASTTISGATAAGVLFGSYADDFNVVHGFIDNNGIFTTVDDPAGQTTSVSGVNAAGVIVGSITDAQYVVHAFVDNGGIFSTLNPPGSYSSSAIGVTASGEVVGNYQDAANDQYGFVYTNGSFTKIAIAGSTDNVISYVSDTGVIVGYYVDSGDHVHGFIDENGTITTVDVPGSTQTEILGINSAGNIYGDYNDASGQHGFVGTPAPTIVLSGQTVSDLFVTTGDNLDVQAGGATIGTILAGGAVETVESGGIATNTSIAGGQLDLKAGAIADNVTFTAGGTLIVDQQSTLEGLITGDGSQDIVQFNGSSSRFDVTQNSGSFVFVSQGGSQSESFTMMNVERVQFSNELLAFDINGDAGQAYRMYQAAFDRTPDIAGLSFWTHQMDLGLTLNGLAQDFINAPEFQTDYGSNPTPQGLVTAMYVNVLERSPDPAGLNFWVSQVEHGMSTATLLTYFSESPENQAHVLPQIQNGIALDLAYFT